jgi:hypothetical protein
MVAMEFFAAFFFSQCAGVPGVLKKSYHLVALVVYQNNNAVLIIYQNNIATILNIAIIN